MQQNDVGQPRFEQIKRCGAFQSKDRRDIPSPDGRHARRRSRRRRRARMRARVDDRPRIRERVVLVPRDRRRGGDRGVRPPLRQDRVVRRRRTELLLLRQLRAQHDSVLRAASRDRRRVGNGHAARLCMARGHVPRGRAARGAPHRREHLPSSRRRHRDGERHRHRSGHAHNGDRAPRRHVPHTRAFPPLRRDQSGAALAHRRRSVLPLQSNGGLRARRRLAREEHAGWRAADARRRPDVAQPCLRVCARASGRRNRARRPLPRRMHKPEQAREPVSQRRGHDPPWAGCAIAAWSAPASC